MALNKVMLIGNVGKDPEVRYLDGNSKVANFTLATTERYRDRVSGTTRENTEWHNIVAWRALADTVEKYVKKGSQLYVEGRIRTRQWTDQSGNKRYTTEIQADNIQLLGRRDDSSYQGGQQQGGYAPSAGYAPNPAERQSVPQKPAPSAPAPAPFSEEDGGDDLPF